MAFLINHSFFFCFTELSVEALDDIEGDRLFRWTVAAICAAIFTPMSGVHHDGSKSLTGVFDAGSRDGTASS